MPDECRSPDAASTDGYSQSSAEGSVGRSGDSDDLLTDGLVTRPSADFAARDSGGTPLDTGEPRREDEARSCQADPPGVPGSSAACGSEFAVIHPETGNEVSRYDTKAEADDAVRWYGETYGRNLQVREVRAGSGPVCLGIEGA